MTDQRKHLVLHIEIPGFYADDLDDCAAVYSEPDAPSPRDRLDVVTEEWMRETVGVTLVSIPGEKCMNDDFEVHAYTGRIVGAETRDIEDAVARVANAVRRKRLCPGSGASLPPGVHRLAVVVCPDCGRKFSNHFGTPVPRHFVARVANTPVGGKGPQENDDA